MKIYREDGALSASTEEKTAEALPSGGSGSRSLVPRAASKSMAAMMQPPSGSCRCCQGCWAIPRSLRTARIVMSPRAKMGTLSIDRCGVADRYAGAELEDEAWRWGAASMRAARVWLQRLRSYWDLWRAKRQYPGRMRCLGGIAVTLRGGVRMWPP